MSLGGVNNKQSLDVSSRRLQQSTSEAATQKLQEAVQVQEAAKAQETAPAGDFVEGIEQAERRHADPAVVDGARARALNTETEARSRVLMQRDDGTGAGPRRGLRPDAEWQEARAGGSTRPIPRPKPKPGGSTKQVMNTDPLAPLDPNRTMLA